MQERQKHSSHHQYNTFGGTAGRSKYTNRHLAALDFLQNVPMAREQEIVQLGRENILRMQHLEEFERDPDTLDEDSIIENRGDQQYLSSLSPEEVLASQNELAGKKLLGPHAVVGKYPAHSRYFLQRLTEQSAVVRQWEEKLLNNQPPPSSSGMKTNIDPSLLNSRVFFSRARSYPVLVGSFIKYNAGEEKAKHEKLKADDRRGMEVFLIPERDWRGHSFKEIVTKQHIPPHEEHLGGMLYDPDLLDDPKLIYGTNKLDMKTSIQTGPILSSIITYVNAKDLKEELNEKFHEMHPALPPSLTLSKIRNVKKEALFFCHKLGLELSTLAMAFICFERLCLAKVVTKFNRKLSMAVCLLIAYKFNESTVGRYRKLLGQLLDFCDNEWDLPRVQIFEAELGALVLLNFLIHLPYRHVHVVYMRLLKMLNLTSQSYLGEDMQGVYRSDVMTMEQHAEEMRNEKDERDRLAVLERERRLEEEEAEEERYRLEEARKEESNKKAQQDEQVLITPTHPMEVEHPSTEPSSSTAEKTIDRRPSTLFSLFDKRSASRHVVTTMPFVNELEFQPAPSSEHVDDANMMKAGLLGGVRHSLFGGPLFRRRSTQQCNTSSDGATFKDSPVVSRTASPAKVKGYTLQVEQEDRLSDAVARGSKTSLPAEGEGEGSTITPLLLIDELVQPNTLIDDPEALLPLL